MLGVFSQVSQRNDSEFEGLILVDSIRVNMACIHHVLPRAGISRVRVLGGRRGTKLARSSGVQIVAHFAMRANGVFLAVTARYETVCILITCGGVTVTFGCAISAAI